MPFYIGKGKSNRVSAHEKETRAFNKGKTWNGINTLKINTINKIWNQSDQVFYQLDSWHDTSEIAGKREIELVEQYGKRINETGCLTNIRDGGDVLSEDDCKRISDSVKTYIAEHPEFVENLMLSKEKWKEDFPEEYKFTRDKIKEIFRSSEMREQISDVLKEYFSDPINHQRLIDQANQYYKEHPEAGERSRNFAIQSNLIGNVERWRQENPEEFRKHHETLGENFNNWKEENSEDYEKMVIDRNEKLRSNEHREKMRQKRIDFVKNNPDLERSFRDKANTTFALKKQIRLNCFNLMHKKLCEIGVEKPREKITEKIVVGWRKKGYLDQYFTNIPRKGSDNLENWQSFESSIKC